MVVQPVTRTSTGKLPTPRTTEVTTTTATVTTTSNTPTTSTNSTIKTVAGQKATPEEIKEKMEQQLRLQRAAHHQKRALEMQKTNQGKFVFNFYIDNCKNQ